MDSPDPKIVVWDAPTRLFHWLLVGLVAAAYVTWRLNWMDWHAWAGEAVLALLLFRVLWGFWDGQSARFATFIGSPAAALRHLAHSLRREPDRYPGHNPAGGWMVLLLLALLFGETLSGLYVNNDVADEGPFTELTPAPIANAITALHGIVWDVLLAAIALHILAVLVYAVAKRHNLTGAMITGRKRLPAGVPAPRQVGLVRALLLMGCGVLAAAALVSFL